MQGLSQFAKINLSPFSCPVPFFVSPFSVPQKAKTHGRQESLVLSQALVNADDSG